MKAPEIHLHVCIGLFAFLAMLPCTHADLITVPNFSFELQNDGSPITAKELNLSNVMAWTTDLVGDNQVGTENHGNGASAGTWHTFMNTDVAFYQVLSQPISAGDTYTLTYDGKKTAGTGNRLMTASFFYDDGGHVEIAGVTTDLGSTVSVYTSDIDTLSFTAPAGAAYLGQNLGIKFHNNQAWAGVDNVRLDLQAIPEPASGMLMLFGCCALRVLRLPGRRTFRTA